MPGCPTPGLVILTPSSCGGGRSARWSPTGVLPAPPAGPARHPAPPWPSSLTLESAVSSFGRAAKNKLTAVATKGAASTEPDGPMLGGCARGNVNSKWPHCDGLIWPHLGRVGLAPGHRGWPGGWLGLVVWVLA